MTRTNRLAIALLAGATAVPLHGQEPSRRPREPLVRMWMDGRDVTPNLMPLMQRRARLGLLVSLEPKETDSLGAFVQSVTPGGPAAKAGIRSGDIITRLDGQSLLAPGETRARSDQSPPGLRLVELAAKLEPNDTVAVEYLRGEARRTTRVVTGDEPIRGWYFSDSVFAFRGPEEWFRGTLPQFERLPERVGIERGPEGSFQFYFRGPLSQLELSPMNADLGWYFGTSEGVLVVRAPESASLPLKAGDVVLSVDGRSASSPASLLRILRSYDEGESFKIEVMRQKQRQTLTARMARRDLE